MELPEWMIIIVLNMCYVTRTAAYKFTFVHPCLGVPEQLHSFKFYGVTEDKVTLCWRSGLSNGIWQQFQIINKLGGNEHEPVKLSLLTF